MKSLKQLRVLSLLLLAVGLHFSVNAQDLKGAWEAEYTSEKGVAVRSVVIFADGFQVNTIYAQGDGAFISTNGGLWSLDGNTLTETVEFDTDYPERVGTSISFAINLQEESLKIVGRDQVWKRLDKGGPGDLAGAWLISGRVRNGVMQKRDTNRPRKTMKILSGTRFQWIAYNTETKQFMGTGGGTYTTLDGKYTENIEFFSRDNTRVGASLGFNYALENGDWRHSGKSSKGSPIDEIWSLRRK